MKEEMVLTPNGFETIKNFIERNRDLVSFVTEPADKIGYGRKLFTEECDAQCGHRRLPFEEQEKYISNFREESITFRIHSKRKRLCQECFDVISYFPIEYDEESVMYIVASSISFVDKITKFYSTFSHLVPLSVYQARRAYCEARISGLTDEQIVSEIRSRLMNVATKKVILGKADDYFERTKHRKDPISFYGNYENPDACIICGNACDKEKKIIDTPHGFKIAIRIHENHLKYIDVNCGITYQIQEGKTEWQNDCAVAEEILTNAANKFKKEFFQWQKEQGNFAVEKGECINKRIKKKPTNEIRLLGTGDLKL